MTAPKGSTKEEELKLKRLHAQVAYHLKHYPVKDYPEKEKELQQKEADSKAYRVEVSSNITARLAGARAAAAATPPAAEAATPPAAEAATPPAAVAATPPAAAAELQAAKESSGELDGKPAANPAASVEIQQAIVPDCCCQCAACARRWIG
jgi:hypothetical protein